jgi:hypothetical protein
VPNIQADVAAVKTVQHAQWDAQRRQEHEALMQWLSLTDFPAQQRDIISRQETGTGQWFTDSSEFRSWLQGSDKTLFCPGIPGAGKTMMAAIAVDHVYDSTLSADVGVAYLFCNYKAQGDYTARVLVAALLKQLVYNRPDLAAPVLRLYEKNSKRNTTPVTDGIFLALESVCSAYTITYIITDALDECAEADGTRNHLITGLRKLQANSDVRLLFTSRYISSIVEMFESDPRLEVRATEEDVRRFVAGQIHRLPSCIQSDQELQRQVQDKIAEAVDGM